jgi:hypothetical protein
MSTVALEQEPLDDVLDLHRARRERSSRPLDDFDAYEPPVGEVKDLNKFVYVANDPINATDPSGMMSLVGQVVTAGLKAGLLSVLIAAPFRVYKAARDVYAGASFREVAFEFLIGAATDFAIGAVLGGGASGLVRAFGSNAFKIRAAGQSIGKFLSMRVPWSSWNLGIAARGLAIEKSILGRAASFLGQKIANFPVIDDYVLRAGRGIATSIKSIDLTLPSYANPAQIVGTLNRYARELTNFATRGAQSARGSSVAIGTASTPVNERILIVAIEEGAANSAQASALIQWTREAATKFPGIKVLVQPIP